MNKKHFTAIVLSAGKGNRMHSDIPKQYMDMLGYPVIYYALKAFEESQVDDVILVTGAEDVAFCTENGRRCSFLFYIPSGLPIIFA